MSRCINCPILLGESCKKDCPTNDIYASEHNTPAIIGAEGMGINFKPIQYPTLPKGLPRFRILWIDGLPQFYPLKTVMQTIWFDGPDGLLGLKANGDLT